MFKIFFFLIILPFKLFYLRHSHAAYSRSEIFFSLLVFLVKKKKKNDLISLEIKINY